MIDTSWPVVKSGNWLYAMQVPCTVRIVRGDVIYGSGDHEDAPEFRDDRPCECFYVVYQCKDGISHGGVFSSLAEAVAKIESVVGASLVWQ